VTTREKLLRATQEALVEDGIAHLSARTVASRAGVNQALVFYHFGSVSELAEAAARALSDESVGYYRERFVEVDSLTALLALGQEIHERERITGNVSVMAQLMAGAQRDEVLARAARYALELWCAEVEIVVRRVLAPSPLADVVEPVGLARAISAAFVGLELYEGVDADGAGSALATLERLGVLVEVLDDLGPVARRAVRARLRRGGKGRSAAR
jgi:AcrR family transcriptional regulator